jgi:hypothetical protein
VLLHDHGVADGAAAVRLPLDDAPGMSVVALAASDSERDVIAWVERGAE